MYIEKDYRYISETEKVLIRKDYAKLTVHSIHFDRHYSEAQKEKNRQLAKSMTDAEWVKHCAMVSRRFEKPLKSILQQFIDRYDIHQISEETDTIEHYKSNWDLYFWSNEGWNGKDYMDCFSLSFNDGRTPEENLKLLEKIIPLVEAMDYDNIGCRIQYNAVIDNEKVEKEAKTICNSLLGKFIDYHGVKGKIKIVEDSDGNKEYGFFRKNAKSKYYRISYADILVMKMKTE